MGNLVHVSPIENEVEAGVVKLHLREENILHEIRCYHDPAYDGIFQLQRGWGGLWVDENDSSAALRIVALVRSAAYEE